ncbi:MAG: energy transducer TonB [Aquificae bacterium]|nr:energy transducer TonB [Aquificota bacterium]
MEWKNLLVGALVSGALHAGLVYPLLSANLPPPEEKKEVRISLRTLRVVEKKETKKSALSLAPPSDLISPKALPKKVEKKSPEKKVKKRAKRSKKAVRKRARKIKTVRKALKKRSESAPVAKAPAKVGKTTGGTKTTRRVVESFSKGNVGGSSYSSSGGVKTAFAGSGGGGGGRPAVDLSKIRAYVMESLRYPYIARKMGWEGRVVVGIELSQKGCERVWVERSSGYKVLDRNAVVTVERVCGKFPKPPQRVSVKIPIVYRLR